MAKLCICSMQKFKKSKSLKDNYYARRSNDSASNALFDITLAQYYSVLRKTIIEKTI